MPTIGSVDQFVLTSTTNGSVIATNGGIVIISAVAHNIAVATNHTITIYRVPVASAPATNNSLGVTTIPFGGAPLQLSFLSGQGIQMNAAFYAVADATNKVMLNATWSTVP